MTTPGKLKSEALNLNSAVRFGVLMPKTRVRGEARAQSVTASELIERLDRVGRLPYLVFLSACESSAPVQRLGGLAQRLVRKLGIPAVIGDGTGDD